MNELHMLDQNIASPESCRCDGNTSRFNFTSRSQLPMVWDNFISTPFIATSVEYRQHEWVQIIGQAGVGPSVQYMIINIPLGFTDGSYDIHPFPADPTKFVTVSGIMDFQFSPRSQTGRATFKREGGALSVTFECGFTLAGRTYKISAGDVRVCIPASV
ncbi:hypothetical protein ACQKPE_10845 [Pseudomonas sp. NPDC089554]|uniref:hypothetical protein n=1 Tax=Pseudomonas sp. NPDC089554 TaxID=3390653 RepID=UPI003CFD64C5